MGIRRAPGPYRMNQEHLLPKFAPKVLPPNVEVTARPSPTKDDRATGPLPRGNTPLSGHESRPKRPINTLIYNLLSILKPKKENLMPTKSSAAPSRQLVQAELSLDTVRVVRNDLTDSDLEESTPRRKTGQPLGIVWNRLSARLLRQAAHEFNVVQRERGKLLTQAGSGSGGHHSS